jgi:hypothetical protein
MPIKRITIESHDHYSVLEGPEADELWHLIVIAASLDAEKRGEWGTYGWKVYQQVLEKDMVSLEPTHNESPPPPVVRCPGCLGLPNEHPSDGCPCIWVEEIKAFVMKGRQP